MTHHYLRYCVSSKVDEKECKKFEIERTTIDSSSSGSSCSKRSHSVQDEHKARDRAIFVNYSKHGTFVFCVSTTSKILQQAAYTAYVIRICVGATVPNTLQVLAWRAQHVFYLRSADDPPIGARTKHTLPRAPYTPPLPGVSLSGLGWRYGQG